MANGRPTLSQTTRKGHNPRPQRSDACARIRPRHRLLFRAAKTCATGLHGAEGRRDGRATSAARDDAPHPIHAHQSRAHARQRDRGGGAMRHPRHPGCMSRHYARTHARNVGTTTGFLSSATRRKSWPIPVPCSLVRGPLRKSLRCLWVLKAGSTPPSGRCSGRMAKSCGFRWGRGSCGADTAAVAGLALVQTFLGDWRPKSEA